MVGRQSTCLRRLADGRRDGIVGYGRFLANVRVTVERLIEGWGATTTAASGGLHVLAIQDTSEINFTTTPEHRRGLGEIAKGNSRGVLLHAMLGVEAETGGLLGLVAGQITTRGGRVETSRADRPLSEKESARWAATAQAAKVVLRPAAMVTEVSDRESDIYSKWACVPEPGFHILTRSWHDRPIKLEGGGKAPGKLSTVPLSAAGEALVELRARPGRAARTARLAASFARVEIIRPKDILDRNLPETVVLSLVQVAEIDPPDGVEPILWRLLTTHSVEDGAMAWQIVGWYRQRWIIEQFFRTLKQQGLQLEDSQVETAERLIKLTAIAARAACIVMQMVQARDGRSHQSAAIAFTPVEIKTLQALLPTLEGRTALQKNPHPTRSLAWAAWIIAKLGGWDGYPKSKPPGPITFRHGLQHFQSINQGWALRDV